jgi:hypothetical protein
MFHISTDQAMANFALGTIVGYNFVVRCFGEAKKTNAK